MLAQVREIIPNTAVPVKIICFGDRMTAGLARNVLARVATRKVLSFIDSDDKEYLVRNEVIKNMFECYRGQLSLLIHSFSREGKDRHVYELMNGGNNGIPNYGVPPDHRCSDEEGRLEVHYGDDLYDRLGETHEKWLLYNTLAAGHMVVHRRVFQHVRFISAYKGEDCMFIRDIIATYGRTRNSSIFLDRPLTWYNERGNNNRDLIRKV